MKKIYTFEVFNTETGTRKEVSEDYFLEVCKKVFAELNRSDLTFNVIKQGIAKDGNKVDLFFCNPQ